jgi:glycerol-3-phosphate acyltransferase PlsY
MQLAPILLSISAPVSPNLTGIAPIVDSQPAALWVVVLIYLVGTLIGYLIGAFPTGYLVVKQMTGQDIRLIGSGGTGATNVRRVAGKKAALFVLLVDFHKGLIPVVMSRMAFPNEPWLHVLMAMAAIIGHSKSVFLGFKGGKSAATGLGGLMGMEPLAAVAMALLAFGLTKVTKFQSVGSIGAGVAAPILMLLLHAPMPYTIYTTLGSIFVIWMHKANIQRLIQGTENSL